MHSLLSLVSYNSVFMRGKAHFIQIHPLSHPTPLMPRMVISLVKLKPAPLACPLQKLQMSEKLQSFRTRPIKLASQSTGSRGLKQTLTFQTLNRAVFYEAYRVDRSWDFLKHGTHTGEILIGGKHLRTGQEDYKKKESKWVKCLPRATVSSCAWGVTNALAIDFCPKL